MNPEDIKLGERVSLSGNITNKTDKHVFIAFHTGFNEYTTIKCEIPSLALYRITPESAPKYDPRRKFRKGDKVRFKEHLGRKSLAHCDEIITLEADEKRGQCFWSEITPCGDIIDRNAYFCYLELVTPVEEQEPYYVEDGGNTWVVRKPEDCGILTQAWFAKNTHPNAKKAAEDECSRLNAVYRKGMEQ